MLKFRKRNYYSCLIGKSSSKSFHSDHTFWLLIITLVHSENVSHDSFLSHFHSDDTLTDLTFTQMKPPIPTLVHSESICSLSLLTVQAVHNQTSTFIVGWLKLNANISSTPMHCNEFIQPSSSNKQSTWNLRPLLKREVTVCGKDVCEGVKTEEPGPTKRPNNLFLSRFGASLVENLDLTSGWPSALYYMGSLRTSRQCI